MPLDGFVIPAVESNTPRLLPMSLRKALLYNHCAIEGQPGRGLPLLQQATFI